MADIENVVRCHLMLLRGIGAGNECKVTNDWLSNPIAGLEVGAPDGETSVGRVIRRFAGLRDAGFVGEIQEDRSWVTEFKDDFDLENQPVITF